MASYGEDRYADSLGAFLRYLDASKVQEGDIIGQTILLEHGSVRIYVSIDAERFSIRSPFLKLPTGGRAIAMMRKAMEISEQLNLSRFVLEGEELSIRYSDELAGCHPAKLLDILSCICVQSDRHDDLFVEQFGAERLEEIEVSPWSGERLDRAYEAYLKILSEGIELSKHWESKQSSRFAYYALDMAVERLGGTLRPQGQLRSVFSRLYQQLHDGNKSPPQRISEGHKAFAKLAETSKEDLAESLYEARFILPSHNEVELDWYQNALENAVTAGMEMRRDRDHEGACMVYLHNAYEDLRRYKLPYTLGDIYREGLESASGLPWRDASEILSKMYQAIRDYEPPEADAPEADYYQKAMQGMEEHQSAHQNREEA